MRIYNEIQPPYFQMVPPRDRTSKRKLESEIEKVYFELLEIDMMFLGYLFDEQDSRDYEELFKRFNRLYRATAETLRRKHKLQMVLVKVDYFEQEYKSVI